MLRTLSLALSLALLLPLTPAQSIITLSTPSLPPPPPLPSGAVPPACQRCVTTALATACPGAVPLPRLDTCLCTVRGPAWRAVAACLRDDHDADGAGDCRAHRPALLRLYADRCVSFRREWCLAGTKGGGGGGGDDDDIVVTLVPGLCTGSLTVTSTTASGTQTATATTSSETVTSSTGTASTGGTAPSTSTATGSSSGSASATTSAATRTSTTTAATSASTAGAVPLGVADTHVIAALLAAAAAVGVI
ncbi:hypothetical protein O9K51_06960 [Purpureocillium lavendulum]|uniref:Extracellular membrane protein CFEM domain-containing protein n=1 Tax=Purpureocillium lavendulum TaxID=1247861 RepID=A0AB34FSX0_9HYPO|nr:hypothetical protein O9K51_06960 [Purpureocillium lavendulum]